MPFFRPNSPPESPRSSLATPHLARSNASEGGRTWLEGWWIDFGRLIGRAFVLGIAVGLLLTLAAAALPAPAAGATQAAESPRLATSGRFLMRRASGEAWTMAPTLATEASFRVAGVVARATVRQRFQNATDGWVEGVYVFPLPENAAVDHLLMKVGERDDRGADPRARAGEGGVPAGEERGEEGEPRRAGAAQPVHDQRRQPGPGRDAGGRDRVPADARASTRARCGCASRSWWGRATSPARGPTSSPSASAGRSTRTRPRRLADHAAARAGRASRSRNPVSIEVELDPGFPLAVARQPLPRDRQPADGRRPLPRDARATSSCRPIATSSSPGRRSPERCRAAPSSARSVAARPTRS